jgi:hypothetical protein
VGRAAMIDKIADVPKLVPKDRAEPRAAFREIRAPSRKDRLLLQCRDARSL